MDVKFEKQGFDFLGDLWGKKQPEVKTPPTLEEIYRTQWSSEFETLMRNRLAMGYFRYGPLNRQAKGKYDNCGSMVKRLSLYKSTGNLEHLVDVANLCLVEFLNGNHPNKHFAAQDDSEHVQETAESKPLLPYQSEVFKHGGVLDAENTGSKAVVVKPIQPGEPFDIKLFKALSLAFLANNADLNLPLHINHTNNKGATMAQLKKKASTKATPKKATKAVKVEKKAKLAKPVSTKVSSKRACSSKKTLSKKPVVKETLSKDKASKKVVLAIPKTAEKKAPALAKKVKAAKKAKAKEASVVIKEGKIPVGVKASVLFG
jgi:hypothetical protein